MICARPGCLQIGILRCSTCLREPYCSSECQKLDWRAHKVICKFLKKFSNQLQPWDQFFEVCEDVPENARIFEHMIAYVTFQLGDRAPGTAYHERKGEGKISNYEAEIKCLIALHVTLINCYAQDRSLTQLQQDNKMFPYVEKALKILSPWTSCLEQNITNSVDRLDKEQINKILYTWSFIEIRMATIYMHRVEFDLSEDHCQLSLFYAKLHDGEEVLRVSVVYEALTVYCNLRRTQDKFSEAIPLAEEAYNLVAIMYNPVHPMVYTYVYVHIYIYICI
jgi:hypothetical protein